MITGEIIRFNFSDSVLTTLLYNWLLAKYTPLNILYEIVQLLLKSLNTPADLLSQLCQPIVVFYIPNN